jgi:hypothetical protein
MLGTGRLPVTRLHSSDQKLEHVYETEQIHNLDGRCDNLTDTRTTRQECSSYRSSRCEGARR